LGFVTILAIIISPLRGFGWVGFYDHFIYNHFTPSGFWLGDYKNPGTILGVGFPGTFFV
jgi:hypothetical protein